GDAVVAALASSLLLYAAAFQYPDGIQVLSAGALRGLKDTRVPMFLAAAAYWGVGMPLGAFLGLWLGGGPRGMGVGRSAGLAAAACRLARRVRRSRAAMPAGACPGPGAAGSLSLPCRSKCMSEPRKRGPTVRLVDGVGDAMNFPRRL